MQANPPNQPPNQAPNQAPGAEPFPIHVAIVEDDHDTRESMCKVIQASPDMRLAGTAATLAEGMSMLAGPPADVLLVDLGLPDGSGTDVIREAILRWPSCSVMVSTNFGDETHVMRSLEMGAAGYLLKDSSPSKIIDEIRILASGGSPISPIIARQVLMRFRQSGNEPASAPASAPAGATVGATAGAPAQPSEQATLLSAREREVLDYITKGFTTNEIAKLMELSHFTVRSFVRRIYGKLKVSSKAEAIYEAKALGLSRD